MPAPLRDEFVRVGDCTYKSFSDMDDTFSGLWTVCLNTSESAIALNSIRANKAINKQSLRPQEKMEWLIISVKAILPKLENMQNSVGS